MCSTDPGEELFWLVMLINFFNQPQTTSNQVEMVEKAFVIVARDCSLYKDYSHEVLYFN